VHVGDDEIRMHLGQQRHRLIAVAHGADLVVLVHERQLDHLLDRHAVVRQQNPSLHSSSVQFE